MDTQTIENMEADYQRGFNQGYFIAKYLPDLSEKLADVKSAASRMEGFRDGRDEFMQEKAKDRLPQWLKRDFSKPSKTKDEHDLDKE